MTIHTPVDTYGRPLPIFALGAAQNIAFNATGGAAVENGTSFSENIEAILITAFGSNDCLISIGASGIAPATSLPTPCTVALQMPKGGAVISVISATAATGTICVTEIVSKGTGFTS